MISLLIAFEGIDGAGKTTVASLLADQLSSYGLRVLKAAKRSSGVVAEFPKEQLEAVGTRLWGIPHDQRLRSLGSLHWIYLNAAYFAGLHHALSAETGPGGIVVFDNWINKFVARVATNGDYELAEILQVVAPLPQPDMVFLLDLPPEVAAARKTSVTDLERGAPGSPARSFESYQAVVRRTLQQMALRQGWTVIPAATATAAEIAADVAAMVRARLEPTLPSALSGKETA